MTGRKLGAHLTRWFAVFAVASALVPVGAQAAFGPLGDDFRISSMGPNGSADYEAFASSVAYNAAANEYLVVSIGDDNTLPLVDDEFEIFAQRVSASGAPLGGRIRVSDMGPNGSTSYEVNAPRVAYNTSDNEYLVVWTGDDNTSPLVDEELEVFGQRLAATGAEVGPNDFRVSDMGPDGDTGYGAFGASVAYSSVDNQFLVTWQGDDNTAPLVNNDFEIFGQRLTAAGAEAGANDFRISDMGPEGNTAYGAFEPSVAYGSADNEFLVTWRGDDDHAPLVESEAEIFGQRVTAAGGQSGANDFRISDMGPNGDPEYAAGVPSAVYNAVDNQFLVVWQGDDNTAPLVDKEVEVFGQRLTTAGAEVGANDFRISDMGPDGATAYGAFRPSVAFSSADDEFLVTWAGEDGTPPLVDEEFEILGQRLTAAGVEVGANDLRITDMGPDGNANYGAFTPRVAYNSADKQFLVTFSGDDNTAPLVNNEFEIFGRRLGEQPASAGGSPPDGGGIPSGGTTDALAPRFLSLALSPTAFAAFSSGPSVRSAGARGTKVSYRLSEAARATFRAQRALAGRRVGGRCVRPTRANRGKPPCKRYRTLRGSFSHTGTAGVNRFRFSGRLAGRKLRPGSYRFVVTAKDAAANTSRPVRSLFRIIR